MTWKKLVIPITAASPDDGTAAAAATTFKGLAEYDWFTVDAVLQGATDDTLDVYLQRKVGSDWVDWLHFDQLAASASAVRYTCQSGVTADITTVGAGTSPALAAGTFTGGHPGEEVRIYFVPGASTSAGANQTVTLTCWQSRD